MDLQGYMVLKLHSDVAAYSSYIELVLTEIVYPQQENLEVKINQYNYFNIIGTVQPPTNHGIWGWLHYLPLILNVFLAQYDSETFLSHLTNGGYGFYAIGSPGTNMYQMYIVAPMVKGGKHYIEVGLIYRQHSCLLGMSKGVPHSSGLSSIDVKVESMWPPGRHTSFERGGAWGLSVTPCHLEFVLTLSFPVLV